MLLALTVKEGKALLTRLSAPSQRASNGGNAMARRVNVNDLLDHHIVLDITCIDRVYLKGAAQSCTSAGRR
jgi:hypothetical protein